MQLVLPFEPPWQVKIAPREQRLAILPGATVPALIVTYGSIVVKPDEPRHWLDIVAADLPAGTRLRVGRATDHTTTVGWPFCIVEADVVDGGGAFVEARTCAFYTFMEHGAAVIARASDRTQLDAHAAVLRAILAAGRPDWRDVPVCLAECWDLERKPKSPRATHDALEEALAGLDPGDHLHRGLVLLDLDHPQEAAAELAAAIALDDTVERAHYALGIALGMLGMHDLAIESWQRAVALAPERTDACYNLAQALFLREDYTAALAGFEYIVSIDPEDGAARRKVIQCLYALERYAEGEAARKAFREYCAVDRRGRHIAEYVFDQFKGNEMWVHAIETLRPASPEVHRLLAFRAVRRAERGEDLLPATVVVETSEYAKAAGTPFVLGVTARGAFRVAGTLAALPPYPQLKQEVLRLLTEALATR